jgi:hypothetical protein
MLGATVVGYEYFLQYRVPTSPTRSGEHRRTVPSSEESKGDMMMSCNFVDSNETEQRVGEVTAPLEASARDSAEARGEGGMPCRHPGGGVRVQAEGARHVTCDAGARGH